MKNVTRSGMSVAMRVAILVPVLLAGVSRGTPAGSASVPAPNRPSFLEAYGKLPLAFEENRGQAPEPIDFVARGPGYDLLLGAGGAVLSLNLPSDGPADETPVEGIFDPPLRPSDERAVVRIELVGAVSRPQARGVEPLPGRTNYLIGSDSSKWVTAVPQYRKVALEGIYPGIDLVYYGNQGQLEWDFVVAPGADPGQIAMHFEGATVGAHENGALVLAARHGEIVLRRPVLYQEVAGARLPVDGEYLIGEHGTVGFEIGEYDPNSALVIDPVLVYSTFLGGSDVDAATGIAADATGAVYVVGYTLSINFPTANPFQPLRAPGFDVFVSKIDPTGSFLVYSTFLGGGNSDFGRDIAVDSAGHAYITGYTYSGNFGGQTPFPTTAGAVQQPFDNRCATTLSPYAQCAMVFVTKLASDGSTLEYSTVLGGETKNGPTNTDVGEAIAVDPAGHAVVTGSAGSDFPTTAGAFQPARYPSSGPDAFVTKLDPAGSSLVYSTFLGGSKSDRASLVAVDVTGHVYVGGVTTSPNFPLASPLQALCTPTTGFSECVDLFVAKLDPSGSTLVYSTFLGGNDSDQASGALTVDAAGSVYISGLTESTDFPTVNPVQATHSGGRDAFVTQLDPTGSSLVFSTYLGGADDDFALDHALDSQGNVFVVGTTGSPVSASAVVGNFPTTSDAFQSVFGGARFDAFFSQLSPDGGQLVYSTFLGGVGEDSGDGVAVDGIGGVYLTGSSRSADFPLLGAIDATQQSGDAFVAKFLFASPNQAPTCSATPTVTAECGGLVTDVLGLDGTASSDPDGDAITYLWTTDCPSATFDDHTSATPTLQLESLTSGVCAPLSCTATLSVDDGTEESTCAPTTVTVSDTQAPAITITGDPAPALQCAVDPFSDPGASASDVCDPSVSVDTAGSVDPNTAGAYLLTYDAADACGNPAVQASRNVSVIDTLAPSILVDTAPIIVTDTACSDSATLTLPTASASDLCDPAPGLTNDAPASFPAGATTTVTYNATDASLNAGTATVDVTVLYGANIAITANKHTVGSGSHPGSDKEPLVGIDVFAYDKSDGSCSRDVCGGISHQHYQCIVDTCLPISGCATDASGQCTINAPAGDWIVISDDATKTTLPDPLGVSASDLLCGETKQKHLQQIVRDDGKKLPGKTTRRTGSELLIIEPEVMEWTDTTEQYPVVFDSVGEWNAEVAVAPPEGFVSDYESLTEQVTDEVKAVQFTLTDVGSDWIPTETRFTLKHGGRREIVLSRVGVKVGEGLAKAKGLSREGHPLGPDGKPHPHAGFDPRSEWPVEISGWIEPSAIDARWTVKLHVETTSMLELAVTRGQGKVVAVLASGEFLAGDHEFEVDPKSSSNGRFFLRLVSGDLVQEVPLDLR